MSKYREWLDRPNVIGRMEAVIQQLGGIEGIDRLTADEIRVVFQGQTAVIEDAGKTLFDCHCRCIPPRGLRGVADANYQFHLIRPTQIDDAERLSRLSEHLRIKEFMTPSEYQDRVGGLLKQLEDSDLTRNAVKGDQACPLPWCLPQMQVEEYGHTLEVFVDVAGGSYQAQFPKRKFTNHRKGELKGQTVVIGGMRHERFLERLAAGPLVGIYLPNALQGFPVFHQRIMPTFLPESFWLGGGIDTAAAMMMWPDVLARDFNTPGLDTSVLQWQRPEYSLDFKADDGEAYFGYRGDLGNAFGNYSGGLFFAG